MDSITKQVEDTERTCEKSNYNMDSSRISTALVSVNDFKESNSYRDLSIFSPQITN